MGRTVAAALLGLALAGPAPARAEGEAAEGGAPSCGPAVTSAVQARYDGMRTLSAAFEQESRNVAFGGPAATDAAAGQVWFAKPGRMRWEYESPEPSLVVSDGSVLWIYDPEAREAQKLPVDREFLSAAAIQFLLGDGRLEETFRVTALACGAERSRLRLVPREEATYESIELEVETATGWIRETVVHDLLGNRTRVAFRELRADAEVPEERFRFVPAEGVRVLTLEPETP